MDDSKSSREWSAHESGSKLCMGLVKDYGWLLDVVEGCLVVAHSLYFSFGRHLDELHVTWAHLKKKRTRLQTNTKTLEDLCSQSLETASARTDSNADLEDSSYDGVLENQLLSASLLICLGKRDCVERIPSGPSPQPQALDTTFEARVRDYMTAHTERMERFENTIFKQREEINGRMTEMFRLFKELTTSRTPEKVLIREKVKFPVTKNMNSISLTKGEEGGSNKTKVTPDNAEKLTETETKTPIMEVEKINEVENGAENKSIKTPESEEAVEAPDSQPDTYYLKHKINEKLIKGGPAYDAIPKKKITKKEDIRGNFEIPCSIRNLKHVNALVDQGSDVNIMPYSTYMKLTDESPTETDIRLSLVSHSYIYPLGITEDVLVEIVEHVYPVDFVILDIRENENRPFILGTPFLTTAKASIKFDTGTVTLRLGKHKASPGMGRKDKASLGKGDAVIFDEKNLGSSLEVSLDDSWRTI
ncbi:MAK10-like protein [Tanacetum coccineum]